MKRKLQRIKEKIGERLTDRCKQCGKELNTFHGEMDSDNYFLHRYHGKRHTFLGIDVAGELKEDYYCESCVEIGDRL